MGRVLSLLPLYFAASFADNNGWINNEDLKSKVVGDDITTKPAARYSLNLDLDPMDRWNDIAADYKDQAYKITDYLKSQLPTWAYPILIAAAADIQPYFVDYGDEMTGLANALELDVGEIVAVNLIYELERIGVNCSNYNNTGPTLDDDAIPFGLSCADKILQFIEAKKEADLQTGPPGLCTSIVSQTENAVLHGRNLDWNIPETLKGFVMDVEVYSGGELQYIGTGAIGFVGFLNGMRMNGEKWTVSQDARHHGGRIPVNIVEALATHAMTPEQAIRKTLENPAIQGFEQARDELAHIPIVTDVYLIMAGEGPVDATVITRDRNDPRDVWVFGTPPETPPNFGNLTESTNQIKSGDDSNWWWLTETNYDHWEPVPKADDRRDPANEYMEAIGSAANTNKDTLYSVMATWPVFNAHTTFTSMMNPSTGEYNSTVWYGNFQG